MKKIKFSLKLTIENWPQEVPVLEKLEKYSHYFEESSLGLEFLQIFPDKKIKTFEISRQWDLLPQFLTRQSEIKDLEISSSSVLKSSDLENIQLKSLRIQSLPVTPEMFQTQCQLTTISIPKLTSNVLKVLCDMPCLERLSANLDRSLMANIPELSNLRNVKLNIILDVKELTQDEMIELTSVRMDCIERILLHGNNENFGNSMLFENIKMNWKNLKH